MWHPLDESVLEMLASANKRTLTIIPVNEPNGEGNGWAKCEESLAAGFEVDNTYEIIEFFTTRKEAEDFIKTKTEE